MKWMQPVSTTAGPGHAVAVMADNRLLVVIARAALVGEHKCTGPCLHLPVRQCPSCGQWYDGDTCQVCRGSAQ